MASKKILVVDDEKLIRWSLKKILEKENYEVSLAESGEEALASINKNIPDLLILDLCLPDLDGIQILEMFHKNHCTLPVLIISAVNSVDSAVKAMKLGAFDYISKPFNIEEVKLAVNKAIKADQLRDEIEYKRGKEGQRFSFENIIGNHPSMKKIIKLAGQLAKSDAPTILIQGESGTGKDMLARAIHYQSKSSMHMSVEINCTAIPANLLESELFGYEAGAFTDAKKRKKGLFEMAEGGTILLEEVGDMPREMQVKLLKVLEDRRLRRVGGMTDVNIDVRVIATTNRNLEEEVSLGNFREDLFYRMNVITLEMPPLRERKDDIVILAERFISEYNARFRKNTLSISPSAKQLLLNYYWPGNIRQLKNVIERIMILEDVTELLPENFPYELRANHYKNNGQYQNNFKLPPQGIDFSAVEKNFVLQALEMAENNQIRSAKLLGISRDAMRRKMKKFNLLG